MSAGSPLDSTSALRYKNWCGCPVTEIYGSTETNILGYRKIECGDEWFTPVKSLHIEQIGESFVISSPFFEERLTLEDHLLIENDRFIVKGRVDKVVKLEERRVSLTLIEEISKKLDHVIDAYALPVEKVNRTYIGLVLAVDNDLYAEIDENRHSYVKYLREELKQHMQAASIPRFIRFVKEIPVNSMNKKCVPLIKELFK
ncbi:MAG: hypothetical protein ACI4NE_00950 [Succinivibrio sp.]